MEKTRLTLSFLQWVFPHPPPHPPKNKNLELAHDITGGCHLLGRVEHWAFDAQEIEFIMWDNLIMLQVALIPYLTAGDPNLDTTAEAMRLLDTCGCDIIELGVPYSDPIADGPIIRVRIKIDSASVKYFVELHLLDSWISYCNLARTKIILS